MYIPKTLVVVLVPRLRGQDRGKNRMEVGWALRTEIMKKVTKKRTQKVYILV